MRSLHKRLDPIKDWVLQVHREKGPLAAMTQFGVATYTCYKNWVKEVTGNANYGLYFGTPYEKGPAPVDERLTTALRQVAELEAEKEALRGLIKFLKWELTHDQEKVNQDNLAILELCQV